MDFKPYSLQFFEEILVIMAVIRPFKALRPTKDKADIVASVPYDVVNRKEAKEEAKGNPLNFLRVTRSEIELDDSVSPYSSEVYKRAKENLERLKKEAPLIIENQAHFYLYRLEMNGRAQVGIAATFSVDDYENDIILKHEKTRREKEDDRTNHIITTEAQTGVVFLTYRGVEAVNKIVNNTMKNNRPEYDFISKDGIKHTLWIVPEDYNDQIVAEFKKIKHLYIADGHHRAASAARARNVKKEQNKNHTGNEEYNYFISVIFPAEQLNILPYNRVVSDINNLSREEFLDKVSEKFIVEKSGKKEPAARRNYGMYLDGQWYMLKARDSILASNSLSNSVAETLDVSILQNFLLNPVLDIDDPRTNKRIDFIGGIRGTKELEKLVDKGEAAVAFSLYPVSLDDLMNISDAGEIMPPKSTWFEPKLRDGLLVHTI
jgi:uncharacterized protein (DUF1015 family)